MVKNTTFFKQIDNGQTIFNFMLYAPVNKCEILYTITVEDGDSNIDETVAETIVIP